MTIAKIITWAAGIIAAILTALALVTRLRGARSLASRSRDWASDRAREHAEISVAVARSKADEAQEVLDQALERHAARTELMSAEEIVARWGRK